MIAAAMITTKKVMLVTLLTPNTAQMTSQMILTMIPTRNTAGMTIPTVTRKMNQTTMKMNQMTVKMMNNQLPL